MYIAIPQLQYMYIVYEKSFKYIGACTYMHAHTQKKLTSLIALQISFMAIEMSPSFPSSPLIVNVFPELVWP